MMKCIECDGTGIATLPNYVEGDPQRWVWCSHCDGEGTEPFECDGCGRMRPDVITVMSSSGDTEQCADCRDITS
jgi:DnaJ-class molecular chaperone